MESDSKRGSDPDERRRRIVTESALISIPLQ
jgi:hypothetical protein